MTRTDDDLPHPPGWDQLISWVAVVEAGSISQAARRLGISQAGVSQHIKQLETHFATPLLDRTTRPAHPTASGQRLFEHASALLRQAAEMTESVRHLSRAKRSIVRLGCVDSFAATVGPQLVRGMAGTMHKVRLSSGLAPALNSQFEQRQLDLLVTNSDLAGVALVQRQAMLSEQYLVALPAGQAFEPLGTIRELSRRLQLLRYSARSVLGCHIESYLQSMDPGIERTFESDATDAMLSLVSAGLGFAITTPLCIWQSRHFAPSLRILPLTAFTRAGKPYPALQRSFFLTYREGELGNLPQQVLDIVRVASRDIAAQIVATLRIDKHALTVH
jgi:DNA-binding transcriptional LysR family regulator